MHGELCRARACEALPHANAQGCRYPGRIRTSMNLTKLITSALTAALLALTLGAGSASAGGFAPQLTKFKAEDRIATGKVARYDLKEESTALSYRIMAQYIEAKVQRLDDGEWK